MNIISFGVIVCQVLQNGSVNFVPDLCLLHLCILLTSFTVLLFILFAISLLFFRDVFCCVIFVVNTLEQVVHTETGVVASAHPCQLSSSFTSTDAK